MLAASLFLISVVGQDQIGPGVLDVILYFSYPFQVLEVLGHVFDHELQAFIFTQALQHPLLALRIKSDGLANKIGENGSGLVEVGVGMGSQDAFDHFPMNHKSMVGQLLAPVRTGILQPFHICAPIILFRIGR